jgi:hypothetical protein
MRYLFFITMYSTEFCDPRLCGNTEEICGGIGAKTHLTAAAGNSGDSVVSCL